MERADVINTLLKYKLENHKNTIAIIILILMQK